MEQLDRNSKRAATVAVKLFLRRVIWRVRVVS